jgi:hypothetical protein
MPATHLGDLRQTHWQRVRDNGPRSRVEGDDSLAGSEAQLSRFKLGRELSADPGTLEPLEAVALGMLAKKASWTAMKAIASRMYV